MNCNVCSSEAKVLFELYDDRYGYQRLFPLVTCKSCRHKMIEGDFNENMLSELYTKYYPRSLFEVMDYKPHKEVTGFKAWFDGLYRSAFRWVPESVRVLDIGCGFAESHGYHKARG